ncbi:MAG: hypothetical protein LBV80_05105 [Deltaproteobacteria bacterium]|nr:hypothetical protein [Deltaproteobacteria bacterium]
MSKYSFFVLSICLAFLFVIPNTAFAHALHLKVQAEDGKLCAESYYSRTSPARDTNALMLGSAGAELASMLTDEAGRACFAPPATAQDLTFVVQDGQGHRAEFIMPANEIAVALATVDQAVEAAVARNSHTTELTDLSLSQETVRLIVREELQAQLVLLEQSMARQLSGFHDDSGVDWIGWIGPGVREVVGGVGWLVGVAGLAAWAISRRKRD